MSTTTLDAVRGMRGERVGQTRLRHPSGRPVSAAARAKARASTPPGRRSTNFLVLSILVMGLALFGVVMVLSASTVTDLREVNDPWYHLRRQVMYLAVGLALMVPIMRIDYRRWRSAAAPGLAGAVFLLVAVLVPGLGRSANGATRWLGTGAVSFQPSEVAKLALVIWVAEILSRPKRRADRLQLTLKPVLVVLCVVTGLVMLQPNLGTTIILSVIVIGMLFLAGIPLYALTGVALFGATVVSGLALSASYRRERITGALHPWRDPLDAGYQTIQSLVSVANGSLTGVGIGESRGKWGYLPFAHTDFIFAIIAEEVGFVGAILVVLAFVVFGFVGMSVSLHAPDRFGMLLAGGITIWVLFQAIVNIGAVLGLVPVTGVPLPFLSYGGSSLVVMFAAMGILLNVARQSR